MPELNHGDLAISSPAFDAHAPIPDVYSKANDGPSPALEFTSVPDATRELVLIVHDPDAPMVDGFTHWVVLGIDPAATGLSKGQSDGFRDGLNSLGEAGWVGMAPPAGHGVHHYFFHLYALDEALDDLETPTRREVLDRIEGHILEQARLVGTFLNGG